MLVSISEKEKNESTYAYKPYLVKKACLPLVQISMLLLSSFFATRHRLVLLDPFMFFTYSSFTFFRRVFFCLMCTIFAIADFLFLIPSWANTHQVQSSWG
jgi:hypothetical protein